MRNKTLSRFFHLSFRKPQEVQERKEIKAFRNYKAKQDELRERYNNAVYCLEQSRERLKEATGEGFKKRYKERVEKYSKEKKDIEDKFRKAGVKL